MQTADNSTEARAKIQKTLELPPLPIASQRLLELVGKDELEVDELARAIDLDPGLSARIIGLARSAFFGAPGSVYTVKDAIIRVLGLDMVKNLALCISMGGAFQAGRKPVIDLQHYWTTAMLTGTMARLWSHHITIEDIPDPDQAYLCGMLHNLGLLPLAQCYPKQLDKVFAIASGAPEWTLSFVERQCIGIDHHDAGSWLAHHWHLPTEVVISMEYHHQPEYRGPHWAMSLLVGYCSRCVQWRIRNPEAIPMEDEAIRFLAIPPQKIKTIHAAFERQYEGIQEMASALAKGD